MTLTPPQIEVLKCLQTSLLYLPFCENDEHLPDLRSLVSAGYCANTRTIFAGHLAYRITPTGIEALKEIEG